ncbi:fatty acid desaturase [Azospirillum sp. sgz302134]
MTTAAMGAPHAGAAASPDEDSPQGDSPKDGRPARKSAARFWAERTAPYKDPSAARSVLQLAVTLGPLAGIVTLMALTLHVGYWLTLLLAVPAALFLARLWILQHDCGHGAFFKSGKANDWVGRCLGVITVTPYEMWRRDHAIHHATSGNLDKRGTGDIDTLTVREYLALSPFARLRYRIYRHPLVLFGLGPTFLFLWKFRFPLGDQVRDAKAWASVLTTNAMILGILALLASVFGLGPVLKVWLPVVLIAATIGIWMFYVQHQFETVYWRHEPEWDFHEAAIQGCSFYDLPGWLHWMTAYVGYHHVHHLASRVPSYRLRDCHRSVPELQAVRAISLKDSLKTVRLALFDEDARRLIGFRDLRAASACA